MKHETRQYSFLHDISKQALNNTTKFELNFAACFGAGMPMPMIA